jgi:RNA 2',3'-cyclic 3'-phosphodiesterase
VRNPPSVRLFLAINLEPELRREIHDATAPLREAAPSMTWVREPQLHLTLKFLGEQSEEKAAQVASAMRDVSAKHRPMSILLHGMGAFPNLRRPRVVWMGIEQEPRLELLHHDVEMACGSVGFEIDARPFRPHLTLARAKGRERLDELKALSRAVKRTTIQVETVVQSIDLMSSELSSSGSSYHMISASPLRGD